MIVEQVAKFSPEERFLYWMRERHNVYLRRLAGEEKPWTDDIILQSYFFTNPYRENDKVTIWVKKHIRRRYARHPNLWFMLCVARQLNRPETLQMLMDKKLWPIGTWRAQKVGEALDAYKTKGNQFTLVLI